MVDISMRGVRPSAFAANGQPARMLVTEYFMVGNGGGERNHPDGIWPRVICGREIRGREGERESEQ